MAAVGKIEPSRLASTNQRKLIRPFQQNLATLINGFSNPQFGAFGYRSIREAAAALFDPENCGAAGKRGNLAEKHVEFRRDEYAASSFVVNEKLTRRRIIAPHHKHSIVLLDDRRLSGLIIPRRVRGVVIEPERYEAVSTRTPLKWEGAHAGVRAGAAGY